jgi:cytochrome c oxidase subunit IV
MTQTTPPPPPNQPYGQPPYYGMPGMPAPNGELVVFLLVWAVVFIVTVASDRVDWPEFTTATVFLAAAYMIARGIAKAGKVLEG